VTRRTKMRGDNRWCIEIFRLLLCRMDFYWPAEYSWEKAVLAQLRLNFFWASSALRSFILFILVYKGVKHRSLRISWEYFTQKKRADELYNLLLKSIYKWGMHAYTHERITFSRNNLQVWEITGFYLSKRSVQNAIRNVHSGTSARERKIQCSQADLMQSSPIGRYRGSTVPNRSIRTHMHDIFLQSTLNILHRAAARTVLFTSTIYQRANQSKI